MSGLFSESARPMTHLDGLNDAQRLAVEHEGGPLIVLAGPGTGKTRVIVSRIAHLIAARGADPGSILALTFTNKAAGEMRERLGEMLDPLTAERVNAYTFNGFGAMLLRRFSDLAGLPREPSLIDSAQRIRMMRTIVRERGLFREATASGIDEAIGMARKRIGAMTASGLTPKAAAERIRAHEAGLAARAQDGTIDEIETAAERAAIDRLTQTVVLWEAFDAACRSRGLLGFDHQIAWAVRMLRENETARAFVRRDYRHVVVDEFQDVNDAQIDLLAQIAPPRETPDGGTDLCVVGDDDQAIYGFRGADDRAFPKFAARWPGARTEMLEENYRSATVILDVAASVIGRAHERFRPDKVVRRAANAGDEPAGAVVEGVRLENHLQAGEVIATAIRADLETREGARLGDHAVIARGWTDVDRIRGALELEGIPCVVSKGAAPADDPGVEDVLKWVDLLLNPTHAHSARRLLLRPPFQTEVTWANSIDNRYKAMVSRLKKEPEKDEAVETPGFMDWLSAGLEDGSVVCPDEATRGIAGRFVRLWRSLREATATAPAHAAIAAIVQGTDVVHAELLDARARAARVSAVVSLLRFARERADRLEEPRDLRAFTAYLKDLDEDDASFRVSRLTHEADEESDGAVGADGKPDAVSLLTAHRAKGLEFDTVHLPRVESQHGYPSVRLDDPEETIPEWLAEGEAQAASGDATASVQDEERRLFYVACTRAERRLVIIGKLPKKKPSGTNYFWELLDESGLIVDREAADVLGATARDGVDLEAADMGWAALDERRTRIRSAGRLARLDAAKALAEAGDAGGDPDRFDAAALRMRDAATRLAVIESAARGDVAPGWVGDTGLIALHGSLVDIGDDPVVATADSVLPGMRAPLELSYTMIDQWTRCPRCFATRFVLKLTEPETVKTVVGKAVHQALESFYRTFRLAGEDESVREPTLDDLLALGDSAFDASWSAVEVIDVAQRERVRALLRQGYEKLHSSRLNPVAFEQAIRFPYSPGGDAAGTGPHWFVAKIDRIDESPDGYRVVDYKTGKASKKLTEVKKSDLQFGIYAMAMRAYASSGVDPLAAPAEGDIKVVGTIEDTETPAGSAEYWVLSTGERGRVSFDELAGNEPKLRETIDSAIAGMLAGVYPKGRGCQGFCKLLDPGELAGG